MGFFTEEEEKSLKIKSMILHVVGGKEFVPESAREIVFEGFFIDRILDTNILPIYSFNTTSKTKSFLENMAQGEFSFEHGARLLSEDFSRLHVATSREGALFIFELDVADPNVKIYSFIKYDYREAIEQVPSEKGNELRKIVEAFVADKKAIQKAAIIRIVNGEAQVQISALDRVKTSPAISDYFATFLDVFRIVSDEDLNKLTLGVLREAILSCAEYIDNIDIAEANRKARNILRNRQEINEKAIIDAILASVGNPDSEDVIVKVKSITIRKIKKAKLEGLEFKPNKTILKKPPLRRVKTTEGIVLLYPDESNGGVVKRNKKKDGGEEIIINTAAVMEDKIVSDSTSRTS